MRHHFFHKPHHVRQRIPRRRIQRLRERREQRRRDDDIRRRRRISRQKPRSSQSSVRLARRVRERRSRRLERPLIHRDRPRQHPDRRQHRRSHHIAFERHPSIDFVRIARLRVRHARVARLRLAERPLQNLRRPLHRLPARRDEHGRGFTRAGVLFKHLRRHADAAELGEEARAVASVEVFGVEHGGALERLGARERGREGDGGHLVVDRARGLNREHRGVGRFRGRVGRDRRADRRRLRSLRG